MATRKQMRAGIMKRLNRQMREEKRYQSLLHISKATNTFYHTVKEIIGVWQKEGKVVMIETTTGKFYTWKK